MAFNEGLLMDIAGHVSCQMLKHYSHIRMQAKGEALEAISKKQQEAEDKRTEQNARGAGVLAAKRRCSGN